jgi:hypothetical protein
LGVKLSFPKFEMSFFLFSQIGKKLPNLVTLLGANQTLKSGALGTNKKMHKDASSPTPEPMPTLPFKSM